MPAKHNVLIVEDQDMSAELIRVYLESSERYTCCGVVKNASLAPVHCARGGVDLVLMDVYTELGADGIKAAAQIKTDHPKIKIIIITGIPEETFIRRAREAGVESFWYKAADKDEMLDIIDRTMAGESIYPTETPQTRLGYAKSSELTNREMETLRGIVRGETNNEIAERSFVSVDTVKMHVKSLLSKTGLRTRTELAVRAIECGLIMPEELDENRIAD